MDSIKADLDRLVGFGFVEPDRAQAALTRIFTTTSLKEASRDSDVVIEAVYEDLELKQRIFRDLDSFCPERTILASSTSTIIIKFVQEKVDKEDLSAKIGKGFYDWTPETADVIRQKMAKAFIEIEKWSQAGG